ncbi:hypothetical protein ACHAWF_014831 [Thalassiosira exigua]
MKSQAPPDRKLPQHGVKGAYYGGRWVDLEDCAGTFQPDSSKCSQCPTGSTCPRSRSRNAAVASDEETVYDVVVVGAGCIGAAIARELSRYALRTLLLESADDVSQGATKGNSGIVHAGYDDKPGSLHAKFCWPGNQMFPQLGECLGSGVVYRELRFGYQLNGSLVVATKKEELKILDELMERGRKNGVQRLRIVQKEELFKMEPALNPDCIAALHSPDAGNVIPYEFAIALTENAVDNGVELRVRREVTDVQKKNGLFEVDVRHWEPKSYVDAREKMGKSADGSEPASGSGGGWIFKSGIAVSSVSVMVKGIMMALDENVNDDVRLQSALATAFVFVVTAILLMKPSGAKKRGPTVLKDLVDKCLPPVGTGMDSKVGVADMFTGGSGSWNAVQGVTVGRETVKTRYVINAAGSSSDKLAKMIGDDSFYIKPRLGDYLLLNRNQGHLTSHTIFPTPDPILGKGVLVQTTLWGNLILGPTARDVHKEEARDMSDASVQEYILSKCKKLCPYFDPKETLHAFCGARAKSSRGDWIIEPSAKDGNFIHVAGIDSPGLAGSPAIALEVVRLLQDAGLQTPPNKSFNPNRAPIITPKADMRGLKMGPVGKNDSNGTDAEEAKMASNVICKCEKVTELEVVRAVRRSLPIDSTQAIRKRTRAGMGHCQGDPDNYNCECRVKAIIARENNVSVDEVGGRPWPATSTLTQRWIDDDEKNDLEQRMLSR